MPNPIRNGSPVIPTTPANTPNSPAAAVTTPTPAAPAGFTPGGANPVDIRNVASPTTGFTPSGGPAVSTPAAATAGPATLQSFEAMVPAQVDVTKYEDLLAAFKTLPKDDRKAALKYCREHNQPGLEKYLKDSTGGGGGFLSSLGNAIGEALFGGHR